MPQLLDVVPRLPVSDLGRTVSWYRDVLKFEGDATWPEDAPTFAILNRDGASLQFHVDDQLPHGAIGHATINLQVDDATSMHRDISAKSNVEWGPEVYWYGRREFAIRDPDGYLIIISEITNDAPTAVDE